jgi:hypothetical protein
MNIASGTPVQKGVSLSDINPKDYIVELMAEKFNGYTCVAIKGKNGIEEGVLVFHDGKIVSSDYEYYRYNKRVVSEEGLLRTLNAFLASKGVMDSFSLSPYQVQLIMTLNDDCNLKNEITSSASLPFPNAFSYSYEEALVETKRETKEYAKDVLLKKYGLSRMAGPKVTRAILLESADDENKRIDRMIKKKGKEE